jgi:Flp pilus assembly protein TadB
MQGLVVSLMPLFLAVAMTVMKPGLMIPFLMSLKGVACMSVATLLVVVGWLLIRKITKIDV